MAPGEESAIATESDPITVIGNSGEHYDVRHLARKGMEVEEISMGEFDEFLKGADDAPNQR